MARLRFCFFHQAVQVAGVGEVAVVQEKTLVQQSRLMVKVVNAKGVEGAASADDAVYLVAFVQEQLGEVTAVLAGDAGNQCGLVAVGFFVHWFVVFALGIGPRRFIIILLFVFALG